MVRNVREWRMQGSAPAAWASTADGVGTATAAWLTCHSYGCGVNYATSPSVAEMANAKA